MGVSQEHHTPQHSHNTHTTLTVVEGGGGGMARHAVSGTGLGSRLAAVVHSRLSACMAALWMVGACVHVGSVTAQVLRHFEWVCETAQVPGEGASTTPPGATLPWVPAATGPLQGVCTCWASDRAGPAHLWMVGENR